MPVSTITKSNLAEQAYGVIREMLLTDGRFHPGDKISVEELTRELGVSRSPIWAAINRLAAEGIVEVRPRDGVFLAGFDRNRLCNLYAVRTELEVMAVRLAAARRQSAVERSQIEQSLAAQRAALANVDVDGYSREAVVFHGLVADASGNDVLVEMLQLLNSRIRGMCLALNRASDDLPRQEAEHRAIADAILAGDAAAAEAAVRSHTANLVRIAEEMTTG